MRATLSSLGEHRKPEPNLSTSDLISEPPLSSTRRSELSRRTDRRLQCWNQACGTQVCSALETTSGVDWGGVALADTGLWPEVLGRGDMWVAWALGRRDIASNPRLAVRKLSSEEHVVSVRRPCRTMCLDQMLCLASTGGRTGAGWGEHVSSRRFARTISCG